MVGILTGEQIQLTNSEYCIWHMRCNLFSHQETTTTSVLTRDVKTVYFSEPVTGLPKPVFYRLPKGLLWVGWLSPVAPRLLSVDRLLLHGGRGPHSRCTDAAKQRTVAYLSGRGRENRCFCRRELITIDVTESARQCKNGCFSLPLQCI